MRRGALYNGTGLKCLLPRVWKADTPWDRMRGLLVRPRLAPGEGLLIEPCGSIHTFGMRYALDLAFLDRGGTVTKLVYGIGSWRVSAQPGAWMTLEVAAGTLPALGIRLGDVIVWKAAADETA